MKIYQLIKYIIEPVLKDLNLYSESAVNLLVGTCIQESNIGNYIKQVEFFNLLEGGLGIYQMELNTAIDIVLNFLKYNKDLYNKISRVYCGDLIEDCLNNKDRLAYNLLGNLLFSTALCRIHYYRVKEELPSKDDIQELGKYWKKYYNTPIGKGEVIEFINNYKRYFL